MKKIIIILLMCFTTILNAYISSDKHKFYAGGYSYIVEADIKADISDARVYFKDEHAEKYQLYVKMKCRKSHCYATLPISSEKLKVLEYFIVYKNTTKNVYRSKDYRSIKRDVLELSAWQKRHQNDKIDLYTEYEKVPKHIYGFELIPYIGLTALYNIYGIELNLYTFEELYPPKINIDICNQCQKLGVGKFKIEAK